MCLVGRQRKKKTLVGTNYFLFKSTKLQSLQNREKTREKTFVHMKKNIWYLMLRYSFFLFFFSFSTPPTSFIHFGLFFIFFYFLFLVSSCFPFYTSIFFSFFFTSFLFLFLFFFNLFTRFCILSSLLSLFLFSFFLFFFYIIIWMPLFFLFLN